MHMSGDWVEKKFFETSSQIRTDALVDTFVELVKKSNMLEH